MTCSFTKSELLHIYFLKILTRGAEQLFSGIAFFRTTIADNFWMASNYRLFMLLQITSSNDSWIIVLLKGTLTLAWKSANLYSCKNDMPMISHYDTFYFMRLRSDHLKILTLLSRQSITTGISIGKILLWTDNFFLFSFLNKYNI